MKENDNYFITSESVSMGHPDKVADQISDAVLDLYLSKDSDAKVACESLVTTNFALIAGEVTSIAENLNIEATVRKTINDIGFNNDDLLFNGNTVEIMNRLHSQSPEINKAVVKDDGEIGAGDQGIMFGYASIETPDLMPLTIWLSTYIIRELEKERLSNNVKFLRPDAKSQISVEYDKHGNPRRVDNIVLSTQHSPDITQVELQRFIRDEFFPRIFKNLPEHIQSLFNDSIKYYINPSGSFIIGGPHGDSGLTGRKIVVDNYGADCQIGGGSFSSKDPSKVDRSASYSARYVAKNIVSAGYADKAKVLLSYAIGVPEPTSIRIEMVNGKISEKEMIKEVRNVISLTPKSIITKLNLKNPIYLETAKYGHFGKTPFERDGLIYYPWEKIDLFK